MVIFFFGRRAWGAEEVRQDVVGRRCRISCGGEDVAILRFMLQFVLQVVDAASSTVSRRQLGMIRLGVIRLGRGRGWLCHLPGPSRYYLHPDIHTRKASQLRIPQHWQAASPPETPRAVMRLREPDAGGR